MHYDVTGQEAENVEMKVWRVTQASRERIFSQKVRTDGYYEADLVNDSSLYICFRSQDYE